MRHNANKTGLLTSLASKYGTDKAGVHSYTINYERHFKALRHRRLKLLEIGIGGDASPNTGGASLRMWHEYFPNAEISGIDINPKTINEGKIRTFSGNQTDKTFLSQVSAAAGPFDIVIDDGSHRPADTISTFKHLFPLLRQGGIYVIEDLQTSYWSTYGGNMYDLMSKSTTMSLLKSLVDSLHYMERDTNRTPPDYFALNVVAIHFYHNIAFINKGVNDQLSVANNLLPGLSSVLTSRSCKRIVGKDDASLGKEIRRMGGKKSIVALSRKLLVGIRTATPPCPFVLRLMLASGHTPGLKSRWDLQVEYGQASSAKAARNDRVLIVPIVIELVDWLRLLAGVLKNSCVLGGKLQIPPSAPGQECAKWLIFQLGQKYKACVNLPCCSQGP